MFAALKMGMTSVGVVLMVFLARYRFMRLMRVDLVLYGVLLVYLGLVRLRDVDAESARSFCPSCNFLYRRHIPYCAAFG